MVAPSLPRILVRAANAPANPYLAARDALIHSFYPTPSPGFDRRLLTLIGLSAYLFFITSIFLGLYTLGLRRQGKQVWGWRLVRKAEGRYIAANIYIASVTPILMVTPLLGALVWNNRIVFIEQGSQIHTFLWRTLLWVLVWLQGWVSSFANVQAVLITSPKKASRHLPTIVNSIYLGVPTFMAIGLLVPAILCSTSWDYVINRFEETVVLLEEAAAVYATGVAPSQQLMGQIQATKLLLNDRLAIFFNQYFGLLITWTVASFILVAVNIAGVVLILRLRAQIKFNADHSFATLSPTTSPERPVGAIQLVTSNVSVDDKTLVDDMSSNASTRGVMSPQPYTNQQRVKRSSVVGAKTEHRRAMQKLVRDLVVTIVSVTFLSLIFAADTILLAVVRYSLYVDWVTAEIGVTMIIWAYLSVLSLGLTLLVANEAYFLFSPSARRRNAEDPATISPLDSKSVEFVKSTHVTIDIASPRDQRHQALLFASRGLEEAEGMEEGISTVRPDESWSEALDAYVPQVAWQLPASEPALGDVGTAR